MRKSISILSICMAVFFTGCTSKKMDLKELHHDIPVTLLNDYKENKNHYVDESNYFNLLFLLSSKGHVARIHDGFQSKKTSDMLLGLLTAGIELAEHDMDGKLLYYRSGGYLLTGLLYSCTHELKRVDKRLHEGGGFKVLWGAFGYHKVAAGPQKNYFLWIPFTSDGK